MIVACVHSTLKFAPKPTVIQPALTPHNINTETQNLMIVIIATGKYSCEQNVKPRLH